MTSTPQHFSTVASNSHLENLLNDLGKMFEKSSAADGGKVSEPSEVIEEMIDFKVACVSNKDCNCRKYKPTKNAYFDLTEEKKNLISNAKRLFRKCLYEEDKHLPEVNAIMDRICDQKVHFYSYFSNHAGYVNDVGFSRSFFMLMRLIFDHLLNTRATIGIPNEYMHFFMKLSRELPIVYDEYKQFYNHGKVLYHKELVYIEYHLKVLSFMVTVQVDK